MGLSPRMRGNRGCPGVRGRQTGSIPAHAGEPADTESTYKGWWVYPRACGGTTPDNVYEILKKGLSPRMRGNRNKAPRCGAHDRSIPAHAGEPTGTTSAAQPIRVYPRACGGTLSGQAEKKYRKGLSPRMRGNPPASSGPRPGTGSIPAHAGEPRDSGQTILPVEVYPRACGGTAADELEKAEIKGLSPRMRGNPVHTLRQCVRPGSIPAHAGEPASRNSHSSVERVYPRACGGTAYCFGLLLLYQGLSPRMRGNPS